MGEHFKCSPNKNHHSFRSRSSRWYSLNWLRFRLGSWRSVKFNKCSYFWFFFWLFLFIMMHSVHLLYKDHYFGVKNVHVVKVIEYVTTRNLVYGLLSLGISDQLKFIPSYTVYRTNQTIFGLLTIRRIAYCVYSEFIPGFTAKNFLWCEESLRIHQYGQICHPYRPSYEGGCAKRLLGDAENGVNLKSNNGYEDRTAYVAHRAIIRITFLWYKYEKRCRLNCQYAE